MLNIEINFKQGILFIRLIGVLNKETSNLLEDELIYVVKNNGIKNVVFNVSGLNELDIDGINTMLNCYNFINYNGKILLCDIPKNINDTIYSSRLSKYIDNIKDEISALKLITI